MIIDQKVISSCFYITHGNTKNSQFLIMENNLNQLTESPTNERGDQKDTESNIKVSKSLI